MKPWTRPAICMGPTGKIQGSMKLMCVETGRKIVEQSYTKQPMSDSIIKKVKVLAEKDKAQNGIIFKNWWREMFEWDNQEYNEAQGKTGQNWNKSIQPLCGKQGD